MLQGSEMYSFVTIMNKMLDRFYKFKRFLINLNIMTIPLAEYVFNLQHNREKPIEIENHGKKFDQPIIGQILSFVPIQSAHKVIAVNKTWKEGFKQSNNIVIDEILKEIFYLKVRIDNKLLYLYIYIIQRFKQQRSSINEFRFSLKRTFFRITS